MKTLKIFTATVKDGEKEIIVQPFICSGDDIAVNVVKSAIREDEAIRSLAMADRVKLYWICNVDEDDFTVESFEDKMHNICDSIFFRKYAQLVYADLKKKEANEVEAPIVYDAYKDEFEEGELNND